MAKPCTVASSVGHTEPNTMTPSTIDGLSPTSEMATGITAEAGSERANASVGRR